MVDVAGPGMGGTTVFIGTVRAGPDDGQVEAIEYSAYDEMADAELDRILAEVARGWPDARPAVLHRVGRVPTGEASVAVVVAAPHRPVAFEASRFIIEEIKKRVPIWKREIFADGTSGWRSNADNSEDSAWVSRSP